MLDTDVVEFVVASRATILELLVGMLGCLVVVTK